MNNKDSHYRPMDGLVEADVPHPQVAKLAENSVARRHARSFRLPMDALTAGVGSLQRQTFNYATMFCKQRKARGQDHEPLADRSQTGSRVRNEELPFSPRLCPDPELRSPYTTVLNIEPHVHLNIRAGGLSCFASLRDDSLRLWPRQSQELLVVEPPQLPNSGNYPKTIPIFRLHVHADICES
jgi:hypothetical protein